MSQGKVICMNGTMVPEAEAKIHVLSPAAKYGATVFEGICAYWTKDRRQMNIFCLPEHLRRLQDSVRILRIDCNMSNEKLTEAVVNTIAANGHKKDVHIRLSIWVAGSGPMESTGPTEWMCYVAERPDRPFENRGKSAVISSWRRIDDTSMPPRIKTAANYNNGRLAQIQAKLDGYDEALLLGPDGKVTEGTGACFFMVRNGRVVTPSITSGILESVTRASVIELAQDAGFMVDERSIDRTEIYTAEEAFLCGSAYEVMPIVSVDRSPVGTGKIGPKTRAIWESYSAAVRGAIESRRGWLTPVEGVRALAAE